MGGRVGGETNLEKLRVREKKGMYNTDQQVLRRGGEEKEGQAASGCCRERRRGHLRKERRRCKKGRRGENPKEVETLLFPSEI